MIDTNDVVKLLSNENAKNIICRQFEFKPQQLAKFIATLANSEYEYGYVVIGATKNGAEYAISNLSKDFKIEIVTSEACKLLSFEPIIEYDSVNIDGKNVYVVKVYKSKDTVSLNINFGISEKVDVFMQYLLLSCIKMQSLKLYCDASEDECNDFIAALLESRGYRIKDQTRRGSSASGKSSGELDIFVEDSIGLPFTVVEALMLNSLDSTYLNNHIDKIYKYDTLGNVFNVCLSYVKVKDFGTFWENYCTHSKSYTYPYKLITCDLAADKSFPFTDIRFIKTTHDRAGKITHLIHICVKIF